MELTTKRLLLREVLISDIEHIHVLNSIPEVDKYNTLGLPKNMEETEALIMSLIIAQQEIPRTRYIWLIEDESKIFLGLIGMNLGKLKYFSGEVWYKLFPNQWGKGYATEALQSVLHFCFNDLKLHRIIAGCAIENKASMNVLQKVGFIKEAHHRKILPIRGNWVDNYEFAMLEEDYFRL
jgi:RimJ/RimL family protein N-acetyltransferase